ncbi:hypothetical protein CHUAL_011156 [Chamberlinius hualienensis]
MAAHKKSRYLQLDPTICDRKTKRKDFHNRLLCKETKSPTVKRRFSFLLTFSERLLKTTVSDEKSKTALNISSKIDIPNDSNNVKFFSVKVIQESGSYNCNQLRRHLIYGLHEISRLFHLRLSVTTDLALYISYGNPICVLNIESSNDSTFRHALKTVMAESPHLGTEFSHKYNFNLQKCDENVIIDDFIDDLIIDHFSKDFCSDRFDENLMIEHFDYDFHLGDSDDGIEWWGNGPSPLLDSVSSNRKTLSERNPVFISFCNKTGVKSLTNLDEEACRWISKQINGQNKCSVDDARQLLNLSGY